jgi:hypothetical protein
MCSLIVWSFVTVNTRTKEFWVFKKLVQSKIAIFSLLYMRASHISKPASSLLSQTTMKYVQDTQVCKKCILNCACEVLPLTLVMILVAPSFTC